MCCALVCCDLCVSFFQSFRSSDLLIVPKIETNGCKGVSRVGPRSANYEADALANGVTRSFDPSQSKYVEVGNPTQGAQHGKTDGARHGKCKSERNINKPRKETRATQAGVQDEGERSVVRFSREGLASALRLTEQMLVYLSLQIAVHSLHRPRANGLGCMLGIPRNSVTLSSRLQSPGKCLRREKIRTQGHQLGMPRKSVTF